MIRLRSLPLALALVLAAGAPLAHADDLVQIYTEARNSDPQLAGAEATKLATDEYVPQARSALLPQIGASLGYSRVHGSASGTDFITNPDGT